MAEAETRRLESKKAGAAGFPVVGLGASAGGLEAFEEFFRRVPCDSGIAFVLVQHLDPGHASILTEILQRSTAMPVVEAQDQMAVVPDSVYVIPPNCDMTIFHGVLQLSAPELPRGHRLPIDLFLRSLAEDQGERAIGIILSGTGTDGTLGLRSILGAGGVSFVQEPSTAKFDGMPLSAIQAGYATHVVPVEKMPEALLTSTHAQVVRQEAPTVPASGLNHILAQVRSGTGHDFSRYKKATISRRVERRMLQHEIADTEVYVHYLKEHPAEVQLLFKELLINVTSFFRDPEAFATLEKDILPQLFAAKPGGAVFRVWVAGCATGEETYSIAILLRELLEEIRQEFKVQIYSSDLGADSIAVARAGVYPPNIVQDVSPDRLRRFFVKEEAGYRVRKEIREMVVFAIQNIIKDPPFTKLDLLSCRNLMIYLEPELQDRLIPAFHYALKPGGVLFLSPSESISAHPQLFAPLSRKWKLYRATRSAGSPAAVAGGSLAWAPHGGHEALDTTVKKAKETNLSDVATRVLLQSYAPASVITDPKGTILYVHGDVGRYLRPPPGHATLNVVDMAREEMQLQLRAAIHGAGSEGAPTLSGELPMRIAGKHQIVSFNIRPLRDPDVGEGLLLVSFQDAARAAHRKPARGKRAAGSDHARQIEDLERELAYTKETLRATIEEQQASNEELMSTNEEMQSTNEELQSTNEELETSQEELQSVNEELLTLNGELQAKIEQLAGMQDDMKNLLDSVNVGTIFLDEHLAIRRFTRDAVRIYPLVASDVGRHLGDIKSELESVDLITEAQAVLETLVPFEREVRSASGAWYLARIQPFRTLENVVSGVVLTFVVLTEVKQAQEALEVARELAEGIVNTVREPLIVLDGTLRVISASRSFYRRFHVSPDETVGRPIYELGDHQWDIPALRDLLETVLPRDYRFDGYSVEHEFPFIGRQKMLLSARRIVGQSGAAQMILLTIEMPAPGEKVSA